MRESFQHHCERMKLELLLKQWDTQRNFPLAPDQISYGSKRKVWWQCEKGHNWQAAVNARTGCGTGCPICAGRISKKRLARYHAVLAEAKEVMRV